MSETSFDEEYEHSSLYPTKSDESEVKKPNLESELSVVTSHSTDYDQVVPDLTAENDEIADEDEEIETIERVEQENISVNQNPLVFIQTEDISFSDAEDDDIQFPVSNLRINYLYEFSYSNRYGYWANSR